MTETPVKEKYNFAYLMNSINHILFNPDGSLKNFKQKDVEERISHQIAIYFKNVLSHEDYLETIKYLASKNAPYFYDITYSPQTELIDSHPSLGVFSFIKSKEGYMEDCAEPLAQKVVNNGQSLYYLINKLKSEAFNNNKEDLISAQSFVAKKSDDKVLKIIYNARFINKPAVAVYDPKISQLSYSTSLTRHRNIVHLIKQFGIRAENLSPELIKYLYEINDQADNNIIEVVNIIENSTSEHTIILKNGTNYPGFKIRNDYLKKGRSDKANSACYSLYNAIDQAIRNPKANKTILKCANFLDCQQETEKQGSNQTKIVEIAGQACGKISSSRSELEIKQAEQDLKVASFLHDQNQDAANESDVEDNVKTFIESKNTNVENWPEYERDLRSNLLDNMYIATEHAFSTPGIETLDWMITPAVNCSLAGLKSLNSAQSTTEEHKSISGTLSSIITEEAQWKLNVGKNMMKIGSDLLNIFSAFVERRQKFGDDYDKNPSFSKDLNTVIWAAKTRLQKEIL